MANEKETKTIIGEVKETLTEAKEKMENVVGEVKEAVVDAAKETANVVTETVEKVTEVKGDGPAPTTKKATWWNRIWSAIVGAVLAVLSMFGITNEKIAKLEQDKNDLKNLATEVTTSIKAGNFEDAKAAADLIIEKVNEKKEAVKETVKKSLIDSVKSAITKNDVKKIEQATTQYTDDIKK